MKTTRPWAVLAYTVADDKAGGDSLDSTVRHELKALCDGADFVQVSVAAQVDFVRPRGVFRGAMTTMAGPKSKALDFEQIHSDEHRLWRQVLRDVDPSKLRVFKQQKDLNAARANVLQDFLRFGKRQCPAERYVVFFYGHAYGPMGMFYDAEAGERAANTMRLNDLASSIRKASGRAAVVVFRDCFMNTLETAYQLRHAAEFIIATQSLAPIAGIWPWLNFLASLVPGAASADVAQGIAMQLAFFLKQQKNRGPFKDVPYSLLDLDAAEALVKPLKALTAELEAARDHPKRRAACAAALEAARVGFPDDAAHPGDPALIDVLTMCDNLKSLRRNPAAAPARALEKVVRSRLVRWHHSQKNSHRGTSLYYKPVTAGDLKRSYIQPENEDDAAVDAAHYRTLALCRKTGWHRVALNPLAP